MLKNKRVIFNLKALLDRYTLRFYDPAKEQLQHALQTTLAATISIMLALIYHWPNSSWLILSSIFMMQIRPCTSKKELILLPLITGIFVSLFSFIAAKTLHLVLIKLLVISMTGFIMVFLGVVGPQFALAGFFVVIFTVIAYGIATPNPYERMLLCLAGTLLAVLISILPLTLKQYRLRQNKINFWYNCHLYWQERIALSSNLAASHTYRFHLLTCFDKLCLSLPAAELQQYAFIFELSCDALLRKDQLITHYQGLFQTDIHQSCERSLALFSSHYTKINQQLLLTSLQQMKIRLEQSKHIDNEEKKDIQSWLQDMERLAKLIDELRGT